MEYVAYTFMPRGTRAAFERFAKSPDQSPSHPEIMTMLLYIREHGVHSVYCKVKEFMPHHHRALRAFAANLNR